MKQTIHTILAMATALGVMIGVCFTGCANPKPMSMEEQVHASTVDLRETLKDTIKDAAKLQQMLAIADQATADLEAGVAELASLREKQERLNADYNASRDEILQLGEQALKVLKETRSKVVSARQVLAQLANDDEWEKITSRDMAILGN
jgi:DNA repair exonuclease SbcCD ATPase subunit